MQVDSSESKQALADLKPDKPPMEPIFPAELRRRQPSHLHLPGPLADWHRSAALFNLYPQPACACGFLLNQTGTNAFYLLLKGFDQT